jgi:outer membrane protein assembly factor BamB
MAWGREAGLLFGGFCGASPLPKGGMIRFREGPATDPPNGVSNTMASMNSKERKPTPIRARVVGLLLWTALPLLLAGCMASPNQSWAGLTVMGDHVILAHNRYISSIDLDSGQQAWKYPETSDSKTLFYSNPLVTSDGDLVAGAYNGVVVKLDSAGGAEKWKLEGDGAKIIAPLMEVPGGEFIASSDNGNLLVIGADGSLQQQVDLGRAVSWGPIAADSKRIYIATIDHMLIALDISTFEKEWSVDLKYSISGGVILSGGKLIMGTFGNKVVAIDPESGNKLWEASAGGWVWEAPAVDADSVYASDLKGTLQALSLQDGSPRWSRQLGSPIQAAPVVAGGMVFVGTKDGKVQAFSAADGTPKWQQTLEGGVFGTLCATGDKLLLPVKGSAYQLAALWTESGAFAWTYTEPV